MCKYTQVTFFAWLFLQYNICGNPSKFSDSVSLVRVRVVVDTRTHVFREYLRENEKVRETIFAYSYGAQVESFKQKSGQKCDTVPLSHFMWNGFFFILLHLDLKISFLLTVTITGITVPVPVQYRYCTII